MIRENINEVIKELMFKRKNASTEEEKALINSELEVVKTIKNTFTKFDKEDNALKLETYGCTELNDTVEEQLLCELKKGYEKTIETFKKANAQAYVDQNELELGFLTKYMPKPPTDEEIAELTKAVIKTYEIEIKRKIEMRDMKTILGIVQQTYPSDSGKTVSTVVKESMA